jgi:hypothetical protein
MNAYVNPVFAAQHDEALEAIEKNLQASGASKETMARLEHIRRPNGYGPNPQISDHVQLYNVLVLQALSEVAKQVGEKKRSETAKKAAQTRKQNESSAKKK